MALTGFDPGIVNTSISNVKSAYESLIKAIGDDMQNKFIGGMSSVWACTQAQMYFKDAFKPFIDGIIRNSNTTFESVVNSMNSAAMRWAEDTKSSYVSTSFSAIDKVMDASVIQENIGGIRGIDLTAAKTVIDSVLPAVETNSLDALTKAQQAVQSCGFVGGAQADNLIQSLGNIKNIISQAIQTATTSTKQAIDVTIQAYSDTEGKISQAFAGNSQSGADGMWARNS